MRKNKFLELNKQLQVERCTIPQAVFSTINPDDETDKQIIERQEKFLQLSEDIKDKLVSSETSKKIENIGKRYGLELLQLAPIARAIRNYYFGDINTDQFSEIFSREIGVDTRIAQEIAAYVTREIVEKDISGGKIIKMSLSDAIKKYPALAEQLITAAPIAPQNATEQPRKPSLGNWIKDYINVMGTGKHSTMERGKYLYGSKRTRTVSATEKNVLSEMIRALEEHIPVSIDVIRNKVIFNNVNKGGFERKNNIKKKVTSNAAAQEESHVVKRARQGNMELRSDHHNEDEVREVVEETNIKSMKFDAPHRLSNEE
ncbi:hypothetical protein ACFL08_04645 [Patescibacteria group bacterium]